ncbi:MAG: type IV secretion system DNA-binding domain-containing protein [Gemmatimonadetes bacterium]|nr:type IV secretion system DNA-binding domain-containing protein [Gemmatimonadota bacterium]
MYPTEMLRLFDEWEYRTRGLSSSPERVRIEPPFTLLFADKRTPRAIVDDGRRPGLFDRVRMEAPSQATDGASRDIDHALPDVRSELVELELLLPRDYSVKSGSARSWLASLLNVSESVALELIGSSERVTMQITCGTGDRTAVVGAMRSHFPEAKLRGTEGALQAAWERTEGYGIIVGLGLKDRVFRPLRNDDRLEVDPLIGIVGVLDQLPLGEVGVVQLLLAPTKEPWRKEFEEFVSSIDDVDKVGPLIRAKFAEPLFAAVLRVAAVAADQDCAVRLASDLSSAVAGAMRSESNELVLAEPGEHQFESEASDLLERTTHRSGMLLSLSEVLTLAHPPSASIRSERFLRQGARTKAAPTSALGHPLFLATNEHDGEACLVSLSVEERLRHTYVIGASGTGKSTLLLSMAMQDVEAGNGFAVLDPHGDLIEDILARIPEERAGDVILFDPADEEFPIGFNILSAHSELERTLLSSDLTAVFKRLSTTFGDQMSTVLGNAILAFLESSEGGTLIDLRRFLVDKSFRARFLETVQDEQVVSYWQQEFILLKGLPHAPLLTRLNTFLRPKLIRHMVAQKEDRLDMRAIMDGRKVLLAKLSQGGIGEENSHLLGSLVVAKIAQAAMSRQDEAAAGRVPFFLYIDEFHHFITPSIAAILSGARKYGLGLTLAHQEMRQLKSRSEEVAGAVLGNAYTRLVFRVGDQDARTLADGFSFFEAKDLQNLGLGEAIARIERPDFDFNLRTTPLPPVPEQTARARSATVIDASRARYAKPKAEVEAILRASISEEQGEEGKPPASRRRRVAKAETPAQSQPAPAVERLPGRGGPQHKYLQQLVRKLAEDRGYTVTVERPVLDGHGHIDVHLQRGDLSIGCEISVSTGAEHEAQNLAKCLSAGFGYAVLISPADETLVEARALFGDFDKRVRFVSPDGFIAFLEEIEESDGRVDAKMQKRPQARPETPGDAPQSKRMLIAVDAAAYLGLATQTLAKMRLIGDSPPFFKVGRRVLYERADLDSWLAQRKRRSTSDTGAEG